MGEATPTNKHRFCHNKSEAIIMTTKRKEKQLYKDNCRNIEALYQDQINFLWVQNHPADLDEKFLVPDLNAFGHRNWRYE